MENYDISVSVIDYVTEMEDGVALILSLKIDSEYYEILYWFDKENNVKIVAEDKFLKDMEIEDVHTDPGIVGLVEFIEKNIPPKEEILKQFNKI